MCLTLTISARVRRYPSTVRIQEQPWDLSSTILLEFKQEATAGSRVVNGGESKIEMISYLIGFAISAYTPADDQFCGESTT